MCGNRLLTRSRSPFSLPRPRNRETGKAALFTRREVAAQDANELRGRRSFWSCRSRHSFLFHPQTPVCRSQRPFLPPPPHAALRIAGHLKHFPLFGEMSLAAPITLWRPWRDSALTSPPPRLLPCRARYSAPPLRARTISTSIKR
jgi:hypothetical protein